MSYRVDTIELQKIMIEKGFDTIGKLAEAADLDRNTVSEVVKGKKRPSTAVIEKLMKALEMSNSIAGPIFLPQTYIMRKLN